MDDLLPGYEEQMFSQRPFRDVRSVRAPEGNGGDDLFLPYDPYTNGDFTQPKPPLPVPVLLRETQPTRALQCLKRERTYKEVVDHFMKNKSMPVNSLDLLSKQFLYIFFRSVLVEIQQNIDYSYNSPIIVQNVISLDGYKQFRSRYESNELNPESALNIRTFTYEQKVYLCVYYFLKMKQLNLTEEEIETSSLLCLEGGGKKTKKYRYSKKSKTKAKKKYKLQSRKRRDK
jgi:hypothetical protein